MKAKDVINREISFLSISEVTPENIDVLLDKSKN